MAKKKKDEGGGGPNWLDTYADMVTLLLTFFVLLFSISSVDANKWQILVRSFSGDADSSAQYVVPAEDQSSKAEDDGVVKGENDGMPEEKDPVTTPAEVIDFEDLYSYLNGYVQENGLESDISLYNGDGYTFIIFRNNIFFDGDSSVLKPGGKQILDIFCGAITNITGKIGKISCEGHTARANDASTPNTPLTDRKLSSDRAVNVVCYIQGKSLIEPGKLVSTGHGEFKPIVPHDGTEATRQKNRRVELCIYEAGKDEKTLDTIYSELNASGKN